jgi:hypothetical protein
MEIKLKYPFTTASGQKIEAVTIRRLKVRDIKAISEQADGKPAQLELLGVARMANLIPEDLEEMDAADYQVLKDRFLDVLGITGNTVGGSDTAGQMVPVPAQ